MGLITRSFDFVNGTLANGDEVDTDLNKIYTEINGNLDDNNVKPSAGIQGSKLAAGSVGTTQLTDDSVDNNKLKDDAAVDANRAVTTNHIRDAAVATTKIADLAVTNAKIADGTIQGPKIKLTAVNTTQTVSVGSAIAFDTGISRTAFPVAFLVLQSAINQASNPGWTPLVMLSAEGANWIIRFNGASSGTGSWQVLARMYYFG